MADTIKKNIGKNTIGDNKKMEVNLRTYNRSTHDLSYVFRNTQSAGTIVPAGCILAQKGDTFDIDINTSVLTHPTVGPLYGNFKHEVFVFTAPIRLYNSWLHNNRNNIGLKMSDIKLPQIQVEIMGNSAYPKDKPSNDNQFPQINPSCVLAYLGLRGYGSWNGVESSNIVERNAIPILGYYDIFKNYFANKQEENFYTIGITNGVGEVTSRIAGITKNYPNGEGLFIQIDFTQGTIEILGVVDPLKLIFKMNDAIDITKVEYWNINDLGTFTQENEKVTITTKILNTGKILTKITVSEETAKLDSHKLSDLDDIRDLIYAQAGNIPFNITETRIDVFENLNKRDSNGMLLTSHAQYGLALKTYNSDIYQNWINTDWIDGENGINEISAVSVVDGSFTMDSLNLAKKVYDMLNRIAVSGGTYKDWLETVYTGSYIERVETPSFEGGMSREIVFQEVVSNSATSEQPLGTLAGRGTLANGQKGGKVTVRITEPSYMIIVNSITPRIDYSQGNEFFVNHKTMDDLHKPALDGIGYQDLLTDGMAYWDTAVNPSSGQPAYHTVGKTVAWIDYMTNVNKNYGNFAINNNEAFMVLNRNYEMDEINMRINDLTTYIDPVKFNYIWADTSLDAMNFWVQIAFDIKCRRLISAKSIPNL